MPFDCIHSNEYREITLNGAQIEGDERWDVVEQYVESSFNTLRECPFPECGAQLHTATKRELIQPDEEWIEEVIIAECPRCAHWQAMWYQDLGQGLLGGPTSEWEAQLGKLAEFELCLPEGCQPELAKHLRAAPSMWHNLSPQKIERLVADIFKANYTPCEVMHVGQPDDGGVDVVFVDSGGRRWLISVKRRLHPAKGEGVATVRNLLGAMLLKNSRYGVVVSTVDHFTYRAYEAASKADDIGFTLSLVDLGKLKRMLTPLLPTMEWCDIIRDHKPEWLMELCARMPDRRQFTFRDYIQKMHSHGRGIAGGLPFY